MVALHETDLHQRVLGAESGQQPRQDRAAAGVGDAQPQPSAPPVGDLARLAQDLLLERADALSEQIQPLARVGERQLAAALEERNAQLLLELGDMPREGLLGDIELLRRTGDVFLLRRAQEILQIAKVHAHRSFCPIISQVFTCGKSKGKGVGLFPENGV